MPQQNPIQKISRKTILKYLKEKYKKKEKQTKSVYAKSFVKLPV